VLWESIYNGAFREEFLPSDGSEFDSFSGEGVERYRVDRILTLPEFERLKGVNLSTATQSALWGFSTNDYANRGNRVRLLYDFGHLVLLQNDIHYDPAEKQSVGSDFNYVNDVFPGAGFDISEVTGVVYLF